MAISSVQQCVECIWSDNSLGAAFLLVDAAQSEELFDRLMRSGLKQYCLFSGNVELAVARAAPWLVAIEPDSEFLHFVLGACGHKPWGIFVRSHAPLLELHRHLRRFLRVQDESGRALLFRYYDPRVLMAYLPTCTAAELKTVFGPVSAYFAPKTDGAQILQFSLSGQQLVTRSHKLHCDVAESAHSLEQS